MRLFMLYRLYVSIGEAVLFEIVNIEYATGQFSPVTQTRAEATLLGYQYDKQVAVAFGNLLSPMD